MTLLVSMLALSPSARAASLDLLEVGGAYGTPGATNPSAIWWNPAGLAVGSGKIQFLLEGAPTFAKVTVDRANPDYGALDPANAAEGYPSSYDYSGKDTLSFNGVVPFLGVSTNFLVPGLGFGIGLAVPTARGGNSDQEFGANRFMIREGNIQALHFMAGGGYQILNKVALGASVSLVDSSWYANTDTTAYPDLENAISDILGPSDTFQDGYIEEQGYSSTLIFGGQDGDSHGALRDTAFTFGTGIYVTPIGKKLGISLSYNHGVKLQHEGDLTMKFQCPPDYDLFSKLGAETRGICNTTLQGKGAIGYDLPARINAGIVLSPIDKVRLEVMGSYVMWSAFTDYDIHTEIPVEEIQAARPEITPEVAAETVDLVSQDRQWARDTENTYWVGVDGKVRLTDLVTVGGRVMYDHHGIPDSALSANNIDFDSVIPSVLVQVNPIEQLGIGLSYSHHFLMTRTTTTSAYSVTIDDANAQPDRYFYPSSNGTYGGSINRLGIVVRGGFGGTKW